MSWYVLLYLECKGDIYIVNVCIGCDLDMIGNMLVGVCWLFVIKLIVLGFLFCLIL